MAGDFRSVMRSQKGSKEGRLVLKVKASGNKSRFGVVISKQVAKKAVDRNRMRRLLTEALRTSGGSLQKPYDIVFIALPGFALKDAREAKQYVENLFSKAKLNSPS